MIELPKLEEKILKFWLEFKIFEKTLAKRKGKKRFVFFEGPPFANGLPGIHHLLARAFKDIILRYKTMAGFYVERRAGWDTHGLPTEMAAEKKLGIKTKKEIEEMGVEKFIEVCKNSVFTYKKEWEEFSRRIGYWLDLENAYITCSNEYIESIWWILKQVYDKGLLYKDYKVVPYCPRCGTSLSSHEVAQGYNTVKENSIYVKLKINGEDNTYLLVWTTTPWTLPGNVAVAANPAYIYAKAKINGQNLILAKDRLEALKVDYEIIEEIKGKDLVGVGYEPLYNFIKPNKKAHYVVGADFVTLKDGSGLVHMAPAFGEDDMLVAKKSDLPVLLTVDEEGKFKKETEKWAGMFVKDADPLIVEDLKNRGLLFDEVMYEHEYPFCWRCATPLLYWAKDSWFIKMTGIKKDLIKNSQKINWMPEYIKKGRFGEWLSEVKDWNLSRERYWGTPLPIWKCEKCEKQIFISSIKELEDKSGLKFDDLHRPYIDKAVFKCECGGTMKRTPEVIDCWFDSGSMPFSQWHYPFENKEKIDKKEFYPADYISEGIDQTRGWFYTLLAISTLLGKEGASYKNVVCLGLVLDSQGQKMSKSKGNIVIPKEVIDKFGADCARFYFYTLNSAGEEKKFDFNEMQSLYRKFFDTLWQSYNFFSLYKSKDFSPNKSFKPKNVLDKWIVSEIENINMQIIKLLDSFDIVSAARLLEDFIDELSNWYIRRARERFQKPKSEQEKEDAENTLYYILIKLCQLCAPFIPFITEEIYRNLGGKEESVHLCDYPKPDKKLIDGKLEEKMKKIREIIVLALAERAEKGIKVRQPLKELKIKSRDLKDERELLELVKDEVNVKGVVFEKNMEKEVELDTEITEELKEEGDYRDLVRQIKAMRKELRLTPNDSISIKLDYPIKDMEKFKKEVGAEGAEIKTGQNIEGDIKKEIEIAGKKFFIIITKK
jgi:isoleucyl-tRNA synthetase